MTPWWIIGIVAVGLLVLALVADGGRVSDPEVIVVRSERHNSGCIVVGAFLLGIVATLLLIATLAQHPSG